MSDIESFSSGPAGYLTSKLVLQLGYTSLRLDKRRFAEAGSNDLIGIRVYVLVPMWQLDACLHMAGDLVDEYHSRWSHRGVRECDMEDTNGFGRSALHVDLLSRCFTRTLAGLKAGEMLTTIKQSSNEKKPDFL